MLLSSGNQSGGEVASDRLARLNNGAGTRPGAGLREAESGAATFLSGRNGRAANELWSYRLHPIPVRRYEITPLRCI